MRRAVLAAFAAALSCLPAAADCGGEVPCPVPGGNYRIALPPEGTAKGVVVFFHGYRGSAKSQMGAQDLIVVAHRHGLAFAAPDGEGGSWSHAGSPSQRRDETRFVGAVLDDLESRFGFGADRVIAAGFSQGASMAYSVACDQGERIAGMVTIAGVFWKPLPALGQCKAPPPIVHVHGLADTVFPLEGRPIGERWHQGATRESLDRLAEAGRCLPAPQTEETIGDLACTVREGCARGPIALCLHPGGHDVRPRWLDAGLTRLGF